MRVLHTSDWHLGRTFHGKVLDDAHATFTDHLLELVRDQQVDAVLLSGDVYDRAVPPLASVQLLDETLRRLSEHTRVVLTPGNHDSSRRLGFNAGLLREGVVIQARMQGLDTGIELPDSEGNLGAVVYALPYLDPDAARETLVPLLEQRLGEEVEHPQDAPARLARSHEAVMGAALRLLAKDLGARRRSASTRVPALAMAHAFVTGGQASESERDIRVGGVDSVPSEIFRNLGGSPLAANSDGLDYVALGHLHRPQSISLPPTSDGQSKGPVLRYSGSPLAFSFDEAPQAKSSVILELGPAGITNTEQIKVPVKHPVRTLRGTLDELLSPAYDDAENAWVRVQFTGGDEVGALQKLRRRFPDLLAYQVQIERPARREQITVTRAADPVAVMSQFLKDAGGQSATDAEQDVLSAAYSQVRAEGKQN